MSDRDAVINQALAGTPWANWQRANIAGDASARRYLRLSSGDASVVVMDAPPATCRDTERFVHLANVLEQARLCAPRILHADLGAGILVLTDLGHGDFAAHLRKSPNDEALLYAAAVGVLLRLEGVETDLDLIRMTPEHSAQMLEPLGTFYVRGDITNVQQQMTLALQQHAAVADTLALRDYHAENLIWRADQSGIDRVGVLDFQDAFLAPAGYDFASLTRDARRDVSAMTVRKLTDQFGSG